jgi:isopentenyldiphosphate isomerase
MLPLLRRLDRLVVWPRRWTNATCRTASCARRGLDALPSLERCPVCRRPLVLYRAAATPAREVTP